MNSYQSVRIIYFLKMNILIGKSSHRQSIIIEQEVKPYKKRDARMKINVELYAHEVEDE
jgi:hypothetical protein